MSEKDPTSKSHRLKRRPYKTHTYNTYAITVCKHVTQEAGDPLRWELPTSVFLFHGNNGRSELKPRLSGSSFTASQLCDISKSFAGFSLLKKKKILVD